MLNKKEYKLDANTQRSLLVANENCNANFSHFNVINSKFHAQNQSYHLQKALFQTVFKRFCS